MTGGEREREGFAAFMLRMRARGIGGKELFAAMEATPRGDFVPSEWRSLAWSERMLPIACGEAIEGCDLQARVIEALELSSGHRVLEVGTGSGFTAAVIARLAGRVISLDRFKTLGNEAKRRWEHLGLSNVLAKQADGGEGSAADGPFDRIVVWAAFEELPRRFVDQLATGGIMIAPMGPAEDTQIMMKLTKVGSRFEREDLASVRLQPLAKGIAEAI
ncbi:protein-L-isoaspartate O-methyltransferase [Nitratireductor indicus C115]|uniref:Protein-L-isoaspartate O-methyltransferase n=1 Tax=Nitratireductor indicus C115 TaxID=1231190 RepID=K2NT90_9HYPH|nr:protein-L-isoaspartate(D-aspartate) O-methyltransferase [Nitratireductor indicus]EKF41009.1 protein-L-isoaspartate O-methyltransferase [Nitratireductor indicus C115]SFQ73764.1 protein-L-isoaspartate(D-aspartate) O-methyltransferase [Nitratireductor indicus]